MANAYLIDSVSECKYRHKQRKGVLVYLSDKMLNFLNITLYPHAIKKQVAVVCSADRWITRSIRFVFWILLNGYTVTYAQGKVKIDISAQQLESDVIDNEPCTKLKGNVVLGLEECVIQADYAIYYKSRKLVEVQGHVKIIYEDGPTMVADKLFYDEEAHLAKLRGHVIYKSDGTTLYTDHFDYNTKTKQGHFSQRGKLVEGDNVLTSISGQYNDLDKTAVFDQDVRLISKDYTLQCDNLRYNTVTKIAYFKGNTKITSKDGKHTLATQEGGEYNTSSQQSTFLQSKVETDAYTLYGDLLRIDQATEIYTVTGHVKLIAKAEGVTIVGDHGQYQREQGIAQVSGNTLMTKVLEEDTLYISADTFVATEGQLSDGRANTTVHAHHNVKLYKEDFQGKADSMVYQSADSTIYFYGDPIFWSYANQLTADSVYLLLQDKAFGELHMKAHAFVVSEDAVGNYNQLRGKDMVASFKENKLDAIKIDGNAESIYFVVDDKGQLKGMNHLRCSQIHIDIEKEAIASITFQLKPVGVFYPPNSIIEANKKLDNFNWRSGERPTKEEVVGLGYGTKEAYKRFKFN